MNGGTSVVLPIGLWWNAARHKEAVLRPMTGAVEEFLVASGDQLLAAQRSTALLARCLSRVGPVEPVTLEAVRQLTVGDREFLLLHLRRMTFGDKMEPVIRCPRQQCGAKMDVPLAVSRLLVPSATASDVPFVVERDGVRFRLPCGEDQEAVAPLARSDPASAARALLVRCIDGGVDQAETQRDQLGAWMAELDPQAEIRLSLKCPACGHGFTSLLDAGAYLYEETMLRARHLYHEVHLLAFHYHWSETEILAMTPAKRRRYIDLLMEALRTRDV
jgi:hypothetical protein